MTDQPAENAARYVPWDRILSGVSLCRDCGSLVTAQEVHDKWHHDLADGVVAVYTEALVEAIQEHAENSPHFYRDGSDG